MTYAVAVDAGGTKIAAAVVDAEGRIHAKVKFATERSDRDRSVAQLAQAAREAVALAGLEWGEIAAVGVDVPGIAWPRTGLVWAPNMPGWDHIPLRQFLEAELGTDVLIDSDRAAYVLGEQWMGAARGLSDVVFVAVGTGIGAGIVTGGRLCRGAEGIAGAVGWFALNPDRKEIYSRLGCWEAEAAGPGLARRYGAATAEEVIEAARRDDPEARQAVEETVHYLGMGIANLVSVFNPEMVVLGGGLMQACDIFLEPVRCEMRKWAQPLAAAAVRIEITELGEDAGLLGAARLALEASLGS